MPKYRIISEINANSKAEALANSSMSILMKAIEIRRPYGERKQWMIVWDRYSYAGIQNTGFTKTQALHEIKWHKKMDKKRGIKRIFSLAEFNDVKI